jgi:methylglutaconyl-CoA hydratase
MAFIKTGVVRGIGRITLDRPELHNAFNDDVIREITAAFAAAGAATDVRVVVLAAEGPSFCAGGDLNWLKRMVGYTFEENIADTSALAQMLRTIRECPKPVIARVHGAAYGGGVGLVAACDIAVAVQAATFCLSEVKLGLVPAVISPYLLEKIGAGPARRYGLTAERFDAAEARRIGLVHEVLDSVESLDPWIEKTCAAMMANGPEALAVCKQVFREVQGASWNEAEQISIRRIAERRVSAEGQEGMKAFLEKRKPKW